MSADGKDVEKTPSVALPDHTSLAELHALFSFSTRAWTVCKRNGLHTLGHLREVGSRSASFTGLDGCGWITSLELEKVLQHAGRESVNTLLHEEPPAGLPDGDRHQVTDHLVDTSGIEDLDLEQLRAQFGLSVRAYHACQNAELLSLHALMRFHAEHGGFTMIRNCGVKTQLELEGLLSKVNAFERKAQPAAVSPTEPDQLGLEQFFQVRFQTLSPRGQRILTFLLREPSASTAIEFFRTYGTRWHKQLGEGVKARSELRSFRSALLDVADRQVTGTWQMKRAGGTSSGLSIWLLRHEIPNEVQGALRDPQGRLTVFRFLQQYMELFGADTRMKVWGRFLHEGGGETSNQDIADQIGLSRERVRQLLNAMSRNFPASIAFLSDLPEIQKTYPALVLESSHKTIDSTITKEINEREDTTWSPLFVLFVAIVVNGGRHQHLPWTELFDRTQTSRQLEHERPLMVLSGLCDHIRRVASAIAEVAERKQKRDEVLDLAPFLEQVPAPDRQAVRTILVDLVQVRFSDFIQQADRFIMPAAKKRGQEDLLEEVLSVLNEPSHVSVIHAKWLCLFPEQPISESGIRAVAVRDRSRFFSIGRTSTYGLCRWEQERPEIKGGTIRSIAESELANEAVLLHISELTSRIQRYRPTTTTQSVRLNLQLEASGRFVFHPGGYIGLGGRVYPAPPSSPEAVPGSLLRANVLRSFIGSPRKALVTYLMERSGAPDYRVEQVVREAATAGRIVMDKDDIIRLVRDDSTTYGATGPELPFQ